MCSGSHSRVYEAYDAREKVLVSCKMRRLRTASADRPLQHEWRVLAELGRRGVTCVAEALDYVRDQGYDALISTLLGPPIHHVALLGASQESLGDAIFPRSDVVILCRKMVGAIREVHGAGFVHGGLQPSSFVFSRHSWRLMIVDWSTGAPRRGAADPFGASRPTLDTEQDRDLIFASARVMDGARPGPMDDVISVMFICLHLVVPLPWYMPNRYEQRQGGKVLSFDQVHGMKAMLQPSMAGAAGHAFVHIATEAAKLSDKDEPPYDEYMTLLDGQ